MSKEKGSTVTRRGFLREAGLLAGVAAVSSTNRASRGADRFPGRPGRPATPRAGAYATGTDLSDTGFRTVRDRPGGPLAEIARIVNVALDEGVNSIDTAPKYVKAEEGIGLALGRRRKDVFLATKVWADTIADAEQSLANSLKTLKTDYVDLLYFHHLGDRDVQRARQADGVFTWLRQQKQAGKCRFLGISGHNLPGRMPEFLESGDVDVLLTVVNYVDRYTYRFEENVLPIARKHNVGIVAMKVFGGPDPKTGSWDNPRAKPLVGEENVELAVRYALEHSRRGDGQSGRAYARATASQYPNRAAVSAVVRRRATDAYSARPGLGVRLGPPLRPGYGGRTSQCDRPRAILARPRQKSRLTYSGTQGLDEMLPFPGATAGRLVTIRPAMHARRRQALSVVRRAVDFETEKHWLTAGRRGDGTSTRLAVCQWHPPLHLK